MIVQELKRSVFADVAADYFEQCKESRVAKLEVNIKALQVFRPVQICECLAASVGSKKYCPVTRMVRSSKHNLDKSMKAPNPNPNWKRSLDKSM